jgi:TonB-linked SusC/RagA family outer membrane protein
MKYYLFFLILISTFFVLPVLAQNRIVQGVVKNDSGAIAGATVMEKGLSQNVAIANDYGRFKITLKGKSNILIFQAIGHVEQEVNVATNKTVEVTLHKSRQELEEVVVVGYGRQKKVTVTGATSAISGAEIRQNPSASLQNSLSGKLPGFFSQQRSGQPGADAADFYIRGVSTLAGGSSTPLILVDDIEFTYDQVSRLDPNEIESITILKDASTTAVFGIKGANGVMLITTRRGSIGKPQISLRSEAGMSQPTQMPTYLNAYESAKLFNQAKINDGLSAYFSDADLELYKNHQDPYGHPDNNWKKILFKDYSFQSRNNLDVSGGTEKVKYFISLGYLWQNGMLKNFGKSNDVNSDYYYKRYNYRSNLDIKVTKTTDLRVDLYGNVGETNSPYFNTANGITGSSAVFWEYSSFLTLSPFAYPIYNPNGSYGYSNRQEGRYNVGNIIARLNYGGYIRNFENNMNLVGTLNQKLDFLTKGLSVKGTVSYASSYNYNRDLNRQTDAYPQWIYNTATGVYTPKDASVYRVRRFFLMYNAGNTIRVVNLQGMLNYDRNFGKHHAYGLILANQNSKTTYQDGSLVTNYVPTNFRGFAFRTGYDYQQKYLLEFNAGYNGSDKFSGAKRYGLFPAVSGGWNMAEENFFKKNIKFISKFKIRASYGLVGSDQLPNGMKYAYQQTYSSGTGPSYGYADNTQQYVAEGTLANTQVTWEKEKKLDIGADMELMNKHVTATVDYFNDNRYDILTTRGTVSAIFGQTLPPVNLGKVNNRGMEAEVVYRDNIGKDFTFYIRANYSLAVNKIMFQDEPQAKYPWQQATGKSVGMIQEYRCIGFYKDQNDVNKSPHFASGNRPGDLKYADLNGDGIIDGYDMEYAGYPNLPNTNAGMGLGATYKNFSFSVLFQGAFNFNVRGVAEAIQAFGSNLLPVHQQAWTPALGDNARYPLLTLIAGTNESRAYPSSFWNISGNYIRLRNAEIGYTISSSFMKKLRISSGRVYLNGNNLLSWSKIQNLYQFDPEINTGTDRSNYPPQRIFNLGLTVTF